MDVGDGVVGDAAAIMSRSLAFRPVAALLVAWSGWMLVGPCQEGALARGSVQVVGQLRQLFIRGASDLRLVVFLPVFLRGRCSSRPPRWRAGAESP